MYHISTVSPGVASLCLSSSFPTVEYELQIIILVHAMSADIRIREKTGVYAVSCQLLDVLKGNDKRHMSAALTLKSKV